MLDIRVLSFLFRQICTPTQKGYTEQAGTFNGITLNHGNPPWKSSLADVVDTKISDVQVCWHSDSECPWESNSIAYNASLLIGRTQLTLGETPMKSRLGLIWGCELRCSSTATDLERSCCNTHIEPHRSPRDVSNRRIVSSIGIRTFHTIPEIAISKISQYW